MQLDRDKLMWLALGALDELVDQADDGPIPPSLSIRTVLAAAYACSDGNRVPYDGFWREMQKPHASALESQARYRRTSMMRTQIRGIVRSLGLPDTVDTDVKMAGMWRKLPHQA